MNLFVGPGLKDSLSSYREGSFVVLQRRKVETSDGIEIEISPIVSALPTTSDVIFIRDIRRNCPTYSRATLFLYRVGDDEAHIF